MADYDLRGIGTIQNGLPASVMRNCMENKNLLNVKGSMYIGTGSNQSLTINNDNYVIANTAILSPGTNGEILRYNSSAENGIEKINPATTEDFIANKATNATNVQLSGCFSAEGYSLNRVGLEINAGTGQFTGEIPVNGLIYYNAGDDYISIGNNSDALSGNSIALGVAANASGVGSTALGYEAKAKGLISTALGNSANASRYYSTAIGADANASGLGSTALGYDSNAKGDYSTALGMSAKAIGNWSTALGYVANASGVNSIALGNSANASGESSIAIGDNANASGSYATVLGYNASVNGNASVAIGNNSTATGNNSIAIGTLLNASGESSVSIGYTAFSIGNQSTAIGDLAIASNEASIAIGAHAQADGISSIAIGNESRCLDNSATAIGYRANASGGAVSLGFWSNASGNRSFSSGILSNAIGDYSIALGFNSTAQYDNSIAIGNNATASGYKSTALGDQANATNDNEIVLGSSSITALRCQVQTISQLSDSRVKEDVELANTAICLSDVNRLPVSRFKYKKFTGTHLDEHRTGFMADDVEKVFPKDIILRDEIFPNLDENGNEIYDEIIQEDGTVVQKRREFKLEKVKSISMSMGLPTLWGAVQELSKILNRANEKIEELENEILLLKNNES